VASLLTRGVIRYQILKTSLIYPRAAITLFRLLGRYNRVVLPRLLVRSGVGDRNRSGGVPKVGISAQNISSAGCVHVPVSLSYCVSTVKALGCGLGVYTYTCHAYASLSPSKPRSLVYADNTCRCYLRTQPSSYLVLSVCYVRVLHQKPQ